MNLKKEGAAIKALLVQADGLELSAETSLEKARMDADEMRWQAAEYCFSALTKSGLTQKAFAEAAGLARRDVSKMVQLWSEWQGAGNRPRYHDAVEMLNDKSVCERAERRGIAPATQARQERRAKEFIRHDDTARVIMRDSAVRESAKRAIVAAEAEEAKQKMLATANPVHLPKPPSGFNWLEARGTLSQARIAITTVIRMVKEHGPLAREDIEALQEGLADIRVAMGWLETVMVSGDFDDEMARLLDEGV
jgi:hypothetical protein